MTENQAHERARARALRKREDVWIVYESGQYDICNTEELETFYNGREPVAGYNELGECME